jgi:hypothetical protein
MSKDAFVVLPKVTRYDIRSTLSHWRYHRSQEQRQPVLASSECHPCARSAPPLAAWAL